jgi:hypothetical protein
MNPGNNFSNFFHNPQKAMDALNIKPTIEEVIHSLQVLTCQYPKWWQDEKLRLVVIGATTKLAHDITQMKERGEEVPLTVHAAAFMMVLGDITEATREFASEMELEMYPFEDENEEEDDNA